MLISGPFVESWTTDCRDAIRFLAGRFELRPVVLLPDDILADDYEPCFEVIHGREAERFMELATEIDRLFDPILICIDLAPTDEASPTVFARQLSDRVRDAWPMRSRLAVFGQSTGGPSAEAFDCEIDLTELRAFLGRG